MMTTLGRIDTGTLCINHWKVECFKQRLTTKQWKAILLAEDDWIWVAGERRQLKAKRLGAGVVEVSKSPAQRGE